MSDTHAEEFEQLVAAHIELGSTREEALQLAQAQQAKTKASAPIPSDTSTIEAQRQQQVRRSVRWVALIALPTVLLWDTFVYRFYDWGWLFLLSMGLPALLGLRQGVSRGIGTAAVRLKESVKVMPHTVVIYVLWALMARFNNNDKIFAGVFLGLLHANLALIIGALSAMIGGVIKGSHSKAVQAAQR